MPSAAVVRATSKPVKAKPTLTRQQAIDIINSMPYLVCASNTNFLPMQTNIGKRREPVPVVTVAFEVWNGRAKYVFKEQPFRIVRRITREEYLKALPNGACGWYYYELHTD